MRWQMGPGRLTVLAVVACLVFVVPVFVLDPNASFVDRLGRAANVAQLLSLFAVAIAIPQLRIMIDEQRRIRATLAAQPSFIVGFDLGTGGALEDPPTALDVPAVWPDGASHSLPFPFVIAFKNAGNGVARDVHFNVKWPGPVKMTATGDEILPDGPDWVLVFQDAVVVPQGRRSCFMQVELPRLLPGSDVQLRANVAASNMERMERLLYLRVVEPAAP